MNDQTRDKLRKSYFLFYVWVILNTILFIAGNVFVAISVLAQGMENSINYVGIISGGFIGFFIGIIQWIILWRNFSVSPLWILSCIVGFAAYYASSWYLGAIIMGLSQQLLLWKKVNDSFRWLFLSIASYGVSGLLLLHQETFCFYGTVYGFLTGILLIWYKEKSLAKKQNLQVDTYSG